MTATKTPTAAEKAALDAAAALGATPVDEHDEDIVEAELVPAGAPGTAVEIHTGDRAPLVSADEWSDVDELDLSPSGRMNIPLYQLNRKAGTDGGFLNEDTGELVQTIEAVLMAKVNTRAWWPQQFGKGDAAPSCRSSDAKDANVDLSPALAADWEMPTRDLRGGAKPTGVCSTCPNSQWDDGNPPPCSEAIEFLAFVPTTAGAGRVVRLRFSGMAFGPASQFWDGFKTRLPRRPAMAYLTSITLEEKETTNGTFLVPKFRATADISRADATPIIEARDARKDEWTHAVATDDRQITTGGSDDEDGDPFDERPFDDNDRTSVREAAAKPPDPDEKF